MCILHFKNHQTEDRKFSGIPGLQRKHQLLKHLQNRPWLKIQPLKMSPSIGKTNPDFLLYCGVKSSLLHRFYGRRFLWPAVNLSFPWQYQQRHHPLPGQSLGKFSDTKNGSFVHVESPSWNRWQFILHVNLWFFVRFFSHPSCDAWETRF